jgi:hypothetical protein
LCICVAICSGWRWRDGCRTQSFLGSACLGFFGQTCCLGCFFDLAALVFYLAACIILDALLGFDHIARLGFDECATACIHLACGQVVQDSTTRTLRLALRL